MTWQILIILSILAGSISLIFQRKLMKNKNNDPFAVAIVTQAIIGTIIAFSLPFRHIHSPDFTGVWINLLLMVLLYAAGIIFRYISLKTIYATDFAVLYQSRVIWIVIFSLIFLKENFQLIQFLGVILVIISIIWLSLNRRELHLYSGSFYSLVSAAAIGTAFINDIFIVQKGIDIPLYLAISFISTAIGIWLFYPRATENIPSLFRSKNLLMILCISVFWAISSLATFYGFNLARNANINYSIASTGVFVTMILAIIFLNEKSDLQKKIACASIGLIGVILIMH